MAASEITGHFFDGPIAKNILKGVLLQHVKFHAFIIKGVVNCQNSQDKGPPEGNSARG